MSSPASSWVRVGTDDLQISIKHWPQRKFSFGASCCYTQHVPVFPSAGGNAANISIIVRKSSGSREWLLFQFEDLGCAFLSKYKFFLSFIIILLLLITISLSVVGFYKKRNSCLIGVSTPVDAALHVYVIAFWQNQSHDVWLIERRLVGAPERLQLFCCKCCTLLL